jgi:choline dehydrogenase
MASGISPSPHKSIPHIHTLPGVGRNLQDHLGVPINFLASPNSHTFSTKLTRIPGTLYDYSLNGAGSLSSQGAESVAFVRLEEISPEFVAREKRSGTWQDRSSGPNAPHLEVLFVPGFLRHHAKVKSPGTDNYYTMIGLLLNPVSVGTVTISEEVKDGRLETLIDPNYYSDDFDTRVMVECVRFMRKLADRMRLDPTCAGVEIIPGTDKVPSDDDAKLQDYVKRESSVYYHPTSTCKMGPSSDPLAVVDARLNVYGIDRLRIVDASIAPKLPAAHTCAMAIMIGEKAADMIKHDWKDMPAKL